VKIRSAAFIKSAVSPDHFPGGELPEIAFAGRSNTGKSSLMNTLVNRKRLVKTSTTPGKTQHLNFFLINEVLIFVDLPGYGYAKVSFTVRKLWKQMIETYLAQRRQLKGVVLVMDSRRIPELAETDFTKWLAVRKHPWAGILTKADKLSRSRQLRQRAAAAKALALNPESLILFSSKTGQGKEQLWSRIETWL